MRHPRLLALILFALCDATLSPAQSQTASPDAAAAPNQAAPRSAVHHDQATGSLHGTVFCGDTHKPARGAFVMIQPVPGAGAAAGNAGGPQMARTGMDGAYTLERVPPGDYGVVALLPGYLSPFDDLNTGDTENGEAMKRAMAALGTVSVSAQGSASHDVTLERGATISGRVLYSDGSPASQATISTEGVNAKSNAPKPGAPEMNVGGLMRTMFTHQSNGTDDQGHFRISGLKPGTYRILAVQPSANGDSGGEDEVVAMLGMATDPDALHMYSGDTIHRKAAKTYDLRAGDEVSGIDITLQLDAFHVVKGQLAANDGRLLNMGSMTLTDTSDDSVAFHAKVQRDGTFLFATVPAGTYTLAASAAGIGTVPPGIQQGLPERYQSLQQTNAFGDGSTTIVVKDSDLLDASLALAEVPMPKNAPQAPSTADPEGDAATIVH